MVISKRNIGSLGMTLLLSLGLVWILAFIVQSNSVRAETLSAKTSLDQQSPILVNQPEKSSIFTPAIPNRSAEYVSKTGNNPFSEASESMFNPASKGDPGIAAAKPPTLMAEPAVENNLEPYGPEVAMSFCTRGFIDISAGLTDMYFSSTAWGDYDNDGDPDILIIGIDSTFNSKSIIYRNDGGTFTDIGAGLLDLNSGSVDWGDYDSDGDLDILMSGRDNTFTGRTRIYRNDSGTFTDIGAGLVDLYRGSVDWGDYDSDGDLDILLTGYDGTTGQSRVYRNDSGAFTDIGALLPGVYYSSAAWGEFDNDGDLDILLTGYDGTTGHGRIFRNDGGIFIDTGPGPTIYYSSVDWGDYDNDGDQDVLLAGWNGATRQTIVYRNDGGSLTDIAAGLPGVQYGGVDWFDYDIDGDLDILLTGFSPANITSLYQNDSGIFTDIHAGLVGVYNSDADMGDYDKDGDLDILLTGYDGSARRSIVYRNGEGCFAKDDSYSMIENSTLTVFTPTGVLANDFTGGYTATLDTTTTNGTLDFQADGSFVYTPTLDFTGVDSFVYHLSSWPNFSATASIDVNFFNDPPMLNSDEYTTTEDTPLNIPAPGVLNNDSDPESVTITATIETPPIAGVVVLDPGGAFVYSPTLDFNGVDTFTYQVRDGFYLAQAYWPLDDGSSPTTDKSGNGYALTVSGAVFTNTDPITLTQSISALQFDGINDFAYVYGIDLKDQSFTVAFWAKRGSTGAHHMVVQHYIGGKFFRMGFRSSDVFTCDFNGSDFLDTPGTYTDTANWHHYACTFDLATNLRTIFVDGFPVVSDTVGGRIVRKLKHVLYWL